MQAIPLSKEEKKKEIKEKKKRCHMSKQNGVFRFVWANGRRANKMEKFSFVRYTIFTLFRKQHLDIDHHSEHMCVTDCIPKQSKTTITTHSKHIIQLK